jgi:response regulator RpfG family c-di-GMP phosphodiesterase
MSNRILFVDDDPNILKGFQRNLRKQYDISVAESGPAALELIANTEPFAVIVADMQMPVMNGVEFLAQTRKLSPDSVRIMLSGNADQETPIAAINRGDIFRFVSKPCPAEDMARLLIVALAHFSRMQTEKDILSQTLKGSIDALSEVLSISKPAIFGKTARLKELVSMILGKLDIESDWQLESLPQLCQIGFVILPDALLSKLTSGSPLSEQERAVFEKHPQAASNLLAHIPRLEKLVEAVKYQLKGYDGSGLPKDKITGAAIPFGARLLRLIMDFNQLEISHTASVAVTMLDKNSHLYDPELLSALQELVTSQEKQEIVEVPISQLQAGMVIAADIHTSQGALLMCKGQEISQSLADRLINFGSNKGIPSRIAVLIPKDTTVK